MAYYTGDILDFDVKHKKLLRIQQINGVTVFECENNIGTSNFYTEDELREDRSFWDLIDGFSD